MKPTLGVFESSSGELSAGSFSEMQAEMNLVQGVLDIHYFDNDRTKFNFSKYPIVPYLEKSRIICEIMNVLWSEVGDGQYENFKNFQKFETFLSAIGKRDHFFHQFLVFLLGVNVIDLICNNVDKDTKNRIFGFKKNSDIYITWLLTATAHDFGYPYHAATKISETISNLYSESGLDDISSLFHINMNKKNYSVLDNNLVNIIIDESNNIEQIYLNTIGFLKSSLEDTIGTSYADIDKLIAKLQKNNDHGFISALLLCRVIIESSINEKNKWYSFKKRNIYKSLMYAISAISLHNVHDAEVQTAININNNIYAYLLFLIDNIQDWYRTFLPSPKYPFFRFVGFRKTESPPRVYLDYLLTSSSWSAEMKKNVEDGIASRRKAINAPENKSKLGISIVIRYHIFNMDEPIEISCSF